MIRNCCRGTSLSDSQLSLYLHDQELHWVRQLLSYLNDTGLSQVIDNCFSAYMMRNFPQLHQAHMVPQNLCRVSDKIRTSIATEVRCKTPFSAAMLEDCIICMGIISLFSWHDRVHAEPGQVIWLSQTENHVCSGSDIEAMKPKPSFCMEALSVKTGLS